MTPSPRSALDRIREAAGSSPIAVLIGGFAALYLACLPLRDLWFPDEPDFVQITREMSESGTYATLTWCGETFDDYPPGYFWIATVCERTLGSGTFARRLPTSLAALGLLAVVAAWARARLSARAAWWATLVLGTSFGFVWHSVNVSLDMWLALWISLAILCGDLAAATTGRWPRAGAWLLCGLLQGAAALTKGPLGIVLATGVLGALFAIRRDGRSLAGLAAAAALGGALFVAWCWVVAQGGGLDRVMYFLYRQNLERFSQGWRHVKPWYYFLLVGWSDLAPWSFFLPFALASAWKRARLGERGIALPLVWCLAVLLFFSVARSKRSVYLLPAYPAFALVVGWMLARVEAGLGSRRAWEVRLPLWVMTGVLAVGGVGVPAAIPWLRARWPEPALLPLFTGLLGAALLGGAFLLWRRMRRAEHVAAASTLGAVIAAAYLLTLGAWLPSLDAAFSPRRATEWLAGAIPSGAGNRRIGYFREKDALPRKAPAFLIYGDLPVEVVNTESEVEGYFASLPDGVVLVEEDDLGALHGVAPVPLAVERKLRMGSSTYLAMSPATRTAQRAGRAPETGAVSR